MKTNNTNGGHYVRRSLRSPWKLGLRIVAWSKPRMFCEEKKERKETLNWSTSSFAWNRRLLWNKWTVLSGRKKKIKILISKTAMNVVSRWVLWWACHLFSVMTEMTCHVNHFFDLSQWCNFSGIEALEFACIYTRV